MIPQRRYIQCYKFTVGNDYTINLIYEDQDTNAIKVFVSSFFPQRKPPDTFHF